MVQTVLLYAATVLIWGSTWAAIRFQLGTVPEEWSIVYRFAIAAAALGAYALVRGLPLGLARRHYRMVIVQGLMLFSANYFFVYYATGLIPSGLVAVAFTALVLMNALNERLFFATAITAEVVVSGLLGLSGIGLIFWPEVSGTELDRAALTGIGYALAAVAVASFGNMAAISNTRARLPVIAVNAHAMFWGAACSALAALALGRPLVFDDSPAYVGSLLYLALPGSAIAFGFYLVLIDRIGAARASYSTVMLPVIALLISTLIEDYRWSLAAVAGVVLTVTGNALVLSRKSRPRGMPTATAIKPET